MSKIRSFTDLEAWAQAHQLRMQILKKITDFPDDYRYGLSAQLQRSSISVGSNIAEGFGRRTAKEKLRFYDIARGSLTEVQDQLVVSRDLGLISDQEFKALARSSIATHKLIHGLMRSIRNTNH